MWNSFTVLKDSLTNGITFQGLGAPRTLEIGMNMVEDGPLFNKAGRTTRGLKPLERRVIALAVAGYSSAESAQIIGISEPAFMLHLTGIYAKLGVSNQFEMILFALNFQLVDANESSPPDNRHSPRRL
jgi:DNA-binding CsgD family transcriptional regulator